MLEYGMKNKARGKSFEKGHKLIGVSIGDIVRGKPSPRKGIKLSDEQKAKISASLKGIKRPNISALLSGKKQKEEVVSKRLASRIGYQHSEATRRKIGISNKKDGNFLTTENERIRSGIDYKIWRHAVFTRDNWTCQICFNRGGKLNADHIKPFALYPELRLAIDNGRTLCKDCHKNTPTYGGKIHALKKGIQCSV